LPVAATSASLAQLATGFGCWLAHHLLVCSVRIICSFYLTCWLHRLPSSSNTSHAMRHSGCFIRINLNNLLVYIISVLPTKLQFQLPL
jgi:hypothetical protein